MKLRFLGAAGTVTGSKYLVEAAGKQILVDCGLFQGLKALRLRNWERLPLDPKSLDAVVLTHAHIDHTGFLPVLTKAGYRGPVYCTPATLDLCKILLPDSGKLQEEEAEYANKKGFSKHHPALPLYTQEDAERSLRQFSTVGWNSDFTLAPDLKFRFTRAGHILGAAVVTLEHKGTRVVFSGDLGRIHDPVLSPPDTIEKADYLILESTYGGRSHSRVDLFADLANWINRAIARNGVVVIPAFSVGRTQTLLHFLNVLKTEGRIADVPVYLNSPMSINATRILCEYPGEHRLSKKECHGACGVARYVHTQAESRALNEKSGPMIILSASGMATGGRVLHHLKAFGPDARNLILLTGFQTAGTRGARLLEGEKELKIHGQMIPIRAEVASLDAFSAHADEPEILEWLTKFKRPPTVTFLTHGEPQASTALKSAIEKRFSWTCRIPAHGAEVELIPEPS